jgi:HEAT repeats
MFKSRQVASQDSCLEHCFVMATPSRRRPTPRQSIEAECERRGQSAVVSGCVDLLEARDTDDAIVVALGGPPAEYVLGGRAGGKEGYWPRVWAARGLSYVWDDCATAAIVRATTDPAWRVREMAAKVIARHSVSDGMSAVIELRNDHVPRVRSAAERAVAKLTARQT